MIIEAVLGSVLQLPVFLLSPIPNAESNIWLTPSLDVANISLVNIEKLCMWG